MHNNFSSNLFRQLRLEKLETRNLLAAPDYAHSAADDLAADFSGGLPQHNPHGEWTYLASDGTSTSLAATDGVNPINTFGVGAGWADGDGIPSYARGGAFGFPVDAIAGHGPMTTVWTAPPQVDLGGIELTGFITQAGFQPTRQMQMSIYKNDSAVPFITLDANFADQKAIVPLPATQVAVQPGDTLRIVVDGTGPLGDGVASFAAWDVEITEIDPMINADFNGDYTVDNADLDLWRAGLGTVAGATKEDGDANDDGAVTGADWLIWQRQFGNSIDVGLPPDPTASYHPAAVIVDPTGVTLYDGTQLDISGTQTQGLQEAFDYAADQGWDVFVLPGTYNLNAHLDVEALQGRAFRLEDVTMNFSSAVTDFGIRFDSTMIVDWYWHGGELNAPAAQHGVLFQPRTPHPLDGMIYGTIGVVDSRFDFGVDITAATYRVTMNTLQATINDLSLHFQNAAANEIHYVGNGFASNNIFDLGRTDDPIPFDLFDTAGRVTVVPPLGVIGGIATVFKPDGKKLDTTGTVTSGLQEAFDFASANDLDVLVFGRGILNSPLTTNIGLYNVQAGLEIGSLVGRTYRIYNVTFNYPAIAGNAITINDMINSDFELTGQVVAFGAANGVMVLPLSQGVDNSVLRVQHVVGSDTHVNLNPLVRSIENSEFYFNELNIGEVGLRISNPGSGTFFQNNLVRAMHTHAMTDTGMRLGTSANGADNIRLNNFELRTSTDGGNAAAVTGVSIWGANNEINYIVLEGGQSVGVRFESASNDNHLTYGIVNAITPILDLGTNNTYSSVVLSASLASISNLEVSSHVDATNASDADAVENDPSPLWDAASYLFIGNTMEQLRPPETEDLALLDAEIQVEAFDEVFALLDQSQLGAGGIRSSSI